MMPDPGRVISMVVLAGLASWLLAGFIPMTNELTHTPHEALKDASMLTNEIDAGFVVTNSARPTGFQYYLDTQFSILTAPDLERLFCSAASGYVYLNHPFRAEEVDTSCLDDKHATRTHFDQLGRGQYIEVWFVPD
jgi:hypothetical protein